MFLNKSLSLSSTYIGRIDIIHSIYRTVADLKMIRHVGIRNLITPTMLPISPTSGKTYKDFFEWQCEFEQKRCQKYKINSHAVIGIPPSNAVKNPKILDEALMYLEEYIKQNKAIGIGEIGLGEGSKAEYVAFKRQLEIAKKYSVPVIVIAPTINKVSSLSIILKELKKAKIDRALIDHCDLESLKLIIRDPRNDIKVGLTVGYDKGLLKPKAALEIYKNFSYEDRICLSSGLGIFETTPFGQTETIELFDEDNINELSIQKMCYDNYIDVFPGISSQINI
jgi:uncharacterized protein